MWKRKRKPCLIDFSCFAFISFTKRLGTDKILFYWFLSCLGWWESPLVMYLKLCFWDICIVHGVLKSCLWIDSQAGTHVQTLTKICNPVFLRLAGPLKTCSRVMYNIFFIRHLSAMSEIEMGTGKFGPRTYRLLKLPKGREIWFMLSLEFLPHQKVIWLNFLCVIAELFSVRKSWGKLFNLPEGSFITFPMNNSSYFLSIYYGLALMLNAVVHW